MKKRYFILAIALVLCACLTVLGACVNTDLSDYVEGTATSPVGYLEGIFIKPEYRNKGLARELIKACEEWAKEKGCKEFASDCELHNEESRRFHMATGFDEANRIICFVKKI